MIHPEDDAMDSGAMDLDATPDATRDHHLGSLYTWLLAVVMALTLLVSGWFPLGWAQGY